MYLVFSSYLTKESVRCWLDRSLEIEVKRWMQGTAPQILGDCFHSELSIDAIKVNNMYFMFMYVLCNQLLKICFSIHLERSIIIDLT